MRGNLDGLRDGLRRSVAEQQTLLRSRAGRWVFGVVAAMAVVTGVALAVMWPPAAPVRESGVIVASRDIYPATVQAVLPAVCPVESSAGCERVNIRVGRGDDTADSYLVLPGDEARPRVEPGDRIRVTLNADAFDALGTGLTADPSLAPYGFVDFRRGQPMLVLALLFVALVALFGRRVGVASLIAVGFGLVLITSFAVPAILDGSSPLAVALVASFAAMYASIVFVYGLGAKSLAALLGTAISLVVIGLLAVVFVRAAHITGTVGDNASLIRGLSGGTLSLQGLVLAGMVIAGLGVLNDVTVSQASTVLALRRAAPHATFGEIYRGAASVGRDHLGAAVNTLVFAYAGASLPLLLVFASQGVTLGDALNREIVAAEVVAALVGSIGLIVSVPLTTLAAALLAIRLPVGALPPGDAGHAH